ncbi:Chk1 protein kinase [Tilletia horrida]|nr:Chk1 protein kinase [Tilletia horrida]
MPVPTSSSGLIYARPLGYKLVQQIGGGGFSKVFRATKLDDDRHPIAAVKVVSFAPPPPPPPATAFDAHGNPTTAAAAAPRHPVDRRALQKEVQIHSVLKHKAVLEFIGAEEYGSKQRPIPSNTVPGLYIVLELAAGGDLFDKIAPDYGLEEDLAQFYFKQLIGGLEYIHSQGVVHRDIKPENLLLDAEGNIKLADFGLCSVYKYKGKERQMHGACGSLPYIAPEMNGKPYRGEPVDVWSAGVVLFALLVGNTPWDEPTKRSPEYEAYLTGELFKYDPWTRLEPDSLSLLRKMLEPDPSNRLSISQIKQHRWYKRENRFISAANQCTDPSLLAERLLHGLMVSGDMHANLKIELHSDGKRAELPDVISHTQPADHFAKPITFGPSFPSSASSTSTSSDWFNSLSVQPPSSALTGTAVAASYRNQNGALKSFSLADAEAQLARLKREGPTQGGPRYGAPAGSIEEGGMSQFTQTFNLLTQWSPTLVLSSALRFSPELTRFFAKREPADVVKHLVSILQGGNSASFALRSEAGTGTNTPTGAGPASSATSLKGIQISIEGCVVQPVGGESARSTFSRSHTQTQAAANASEEAQDADGDSQMVSTPSAAEGIAPSSSTTLVDAAAASSPPVSPSSAETTAASALGPSSSLVRSSSSETVRPSAAGAGSGSASASANTGPPAELEYIVSSSGARIRLSTMDRRKCPLKGEIFVAPFRAVRVAKEADAEDGAGEEEEEEKEGDGVEGKKEQEQQEAEVAPRCVVLWKRSKGNPLEWRKLFRAVTADPELQAMLVRV